MTYLTEQQAYTQPYETRAQQTFEVGEMVEVGPAYQAGGTYRNDGSEGRYTVVGVIHAAVLCDRYHCGPDYYVARGDWRHNPSKAYWDYCVSPTRLTRI